MKIAYFNCFAGASGDMILGSLLDAGLDLEFLRTELTKLHLHGYELKAEKTSKKGISGTKFDVIIGGEPDTPHAHHNQGHVHKPGGKHEHHHRNLKDIREMIQSSALSEIVKEKSIRIFTRLAEAEAKIHNKPVDEIHFHEVGAVDSIVDIVGAVIGLDFLRIEKCLISKIHVGSGTVECAHGTLPVPAPATLELLGGFPVYSTGIESELLTPTGAAILTTLAETYGPMPDMTVEKTGYGAGFFELPIANMLRVTIGEESSGHETDHIQLIETNIDDMNPQFYEHIMEQLFRAGAKDVFMTPIIMKKSRPGIILSVIAHPTEIDKLTEIIFKETTTLGVRISDVKKRMILDRKLLKITTPWGEGQVKIRILEDGSKTYEPEYADCRRLAESSGLPIQTMYDHLRQAAGQDN